jgi:hypothetical protein
MAGRLYDLTASYMIPFLIAAGCGAIAGAAAWRARALRVKIRGLTHPGGAGHGHGRP